MFRFDNYVGSAAYGEGSVWVRNRESRATAGKSSGSTAKTNEIVARIPVPAVPSHEVGGGGITVADGSVWVVGPIETTEARGEDAGQPVSGRLPPGRGVRSHFPRPAPHCAVLMLTRGTDVKTAAARLGHDPGMLLRKYAHFVRSSDEAAAERLGRVLGQVLEVVRVAEV
jgi:hypothetical protein